MTRKHLISLTLASLTFIGLGFLLFSSTGRDDVFKTFWSAYSLSEFGSILNYNGEAVEQSSSLLQVFLLGGLRALFGGDIVVWGYWMGIFAGVGSIWMVFLIALELKTDPQRLKAIPWLLAGCGFLVYWSFSGMETSLQALTLAGFAWGTLRYLGHQKWGPVLIFFPLFLLCRPENPFLAIAILGFAALLLRDSRKQLLYLTGLVVFLTGCLFLFRYLAFERFFPLPVYAKAGGLGFARVYQGLRYLFIQLKDHPDLILYTLATLAGAWTVVRRWNRRPAHTFLLITITTGVLAVIFSGGDWMENGRFLVPWLLLGMLLLPEGRTWRTWLVPVLVTVQLMGVVWTARHHSTGRPLWTALPPTDQGMYTATAQMNPAASDYPWFVRANRIHARDLGVIEAMGDLVEAEYQTRRIPPRVLSQQAGMVAYYTARDHFRKFRFIDLVGLTTSDFHDCPRTADRGHGFGGLNMDLKYLIQDQEELKRKCGFTLPDLIFDLDNELDERKDALDGYRLLYQERGYVETGDPFLPGLEVSRFQFVAIRDY